MALALLVCLIGVASTAAAQVPTLPPGSAMPTPAQAAAALQNPGLAGQVQQMVQGSGLTPDQIRQRLEAQGYPSSLLDQYLPGATADSTAVPGQDVFAAVRALGLGDSLKVDSLSLRARTTHKLRVANDSAFLDTVAHAIKDDSTRAALRTFLQSRTLQRAQFDSGFKVFGLDIFQNETSQFNPNTGGAVDPDYRFGPGDQLVLVLTGDVERSLRLPVTKEGFVVIPDVGEVTVAGLTRAQLEDELYSRLGKVYSGVRRGPNATTHFFIDVSQIGSNQVYVHGDVAHPGSYQVSRAGTAMTALYMAGGPTVNGSLRNVQVMRNGQTVATLDVYDYALHGDASHDMRLDNGDIVFVAPRGPQVRVAGAVLRPATYEAKPGQTVAQVIQLAGGFDAPADRRVVHIERIVPPAERTASGADRRAVDVPSDLFDSAPVRAGDVLTVDLVAARVANRVDVTGNVWSPGPEGLTPGMHLSDALRRAGGLKPDSYLGEVTVSRLLPDSTREMLRTAMYDTTGRATDDLTLADGDVIQVFSTTALRPKLYVTITGAVRKPGQIPYRQGMTLHDAVLFADGLSEGASLSDAEIARLPENRAAGIAAITTDVPLDSTYLFLRTAGDRYIGPPGEPARVALAPQVLLQPYDNVLIKRQPEWELQQTVTLAGEVRYPGTYTLKSRNERLDDLVARAGGLTASADSNGILLVRTQGKVGRVGVDLPAALRNSRDVNNVALVGGDSVTILRYTQLVVVHGAVNAPGGVAYVPGADLDFYIRAAGGENVKGDHGGAYVTQANGRVESRHRHLLFVSNPTPEPGSTVTVPNKDPNANTDWAAIAAATTSVLSSLVALAAILR
jgi:protein involved in polysaccharide export with SLBB domain